MRIKRQEQLRLTFHSFFPPFFGEKWFRVSISSVEPTHLETPLAPMDSAVSLSEVKWYRNTLDGLSMTTVIQGFNGPCLEWMDNPSDHLGSVKSIWWVSMSCYLKCYTATFRLATPPRPPLTPPRVRVSRFAHLTDIEWRSTNYKAIERCCGRSVTVRSLEKLILIQNNIDATSLDETPQPHNAKQYHVLVVCIIS